MTALEALARWPLSTLWQRPTGDIIAIAGHRSDGHIGTEHPGCHDCDWKATREQAVEWIEVRTCPA